MIDESFFDAKGEVRPDRVDEFVAKLRAECLARGGPVTLTGPEGNALAADRAKRKPWRMETTGLVPLSKKALALMSLLHSSGVNLPVSRRA